MLRQDGRVAIYLVQHSYDGLKWIDSSVDHFSLHRFFSSSNPCWQEYGVVGTADLVVAKDACAHATKYARERGSDLKFRVAWRSIEQHTVPVEG